DVTLVARRQVSHKVAETGKVNRRAIHFRRGTAPFRRLGNAEQDFETPPGCSRNQMIQFAETPIVVGIGLWLVDFPGYLHFDPSGAEIGNVIEDGVELLSM